MASKIRTGNFIFRENPRDDYAAKVSSQKAPPSSSNSKKSAAKKQ